MREGFGHSVSFEASPENMSRDESKSQYRELLLMRQYYVLKALKEKGGSGDVDELALAAIGLRDVSEKLGLPAGVAPALSPDELNRRMRSVEKSLGVYKPEAAEKLLPPEPPSPLSQRYRKLVSMRNFYIKSELAASLKDSKNKAGKDKSVSAASARDGYARLLGLKPGEAPSESLENVESELEIMRESLNLEREVTLN